jgi:hypothetical protein
LQGRANSGVTLPLARLLADDFIRMSARKLIYRAMVCAPAMFVIGIGVHARGLSDDFEFVANDARTERLQLAYVP